MYGNAALHVAKCYHSMSYLNIKFVIIQSRENRLGESIDFVKIWIGPDLLSSAPEFLSNGDYHTELAFQNTLRQKHNAVVALRVVILQQKHNAVAALRVTMH